MNTTFNSFVSEARENDFVVIPLADKRPIPFEWQKRTDFSENEWEKATAIGLRCGKMTDEFAVVCIDIDTKEPDILRLVSDTIERRLNEAGIKAMKNSFYVEESRNGFHVVLLTTEPRSGNRKLYYKDGKCLVETREEGGQVRIAPSEGNKAHNCLFDIEDIFDADIIEAVFSDLNNKPVAPTRPVALKETAMIATDNPADDLRQNPESLVRFLLCNAWTLLKEDSERWYVQRPGAVGSDNHSITVARDGGAVKIWSSNLVTSQEETVSPLTFIANEFFHGDCKVAGREWRVNVMTTSNETMSEEDKAMIERIAEKLEARRAAKEQISRATADWSEGIEQAIAWSRLHEEERGFAPTALFENNYALSQFVKAQQPRDQYDYSSAFSAAWSTLSFLASQRFSAHHCDVGNKLRREGASHYTILTAPTGSGKDDALKFVRRSTEYFTDCINSRERSFASAATDEDGNEITQFKEKNFLYGDVASTQSFQRDFADTGKAMVTIDEAGDFIEAITSKNAMSCMKSFIKLMKEAYTSEFDVLPVELSNSSRKDMKCTRIRIRRPALNMFLCGVPSKFESSKDALADDGTLGRCDVYIANQRPVKEQTIDYDALFNACPAVAEGLPACVRETIEQFAYKDEEVDVAYTREAFEILLRFQLEQIIPARQKWASLNENFSNVLNQMPRRLFKAALVYAVGRAHKASEFAHLKIEKEDAENAVRNTLWQIVQLVQFFSIGSGIEEDKDMIALRKISSDVAVDGWFTKGSLRNTRVKTHLSRRRAEQLIDDYANSGILEKKAGPRNSEIYRFVD